MKKFLILLLTVFGLVACKMPESTIYYENLYGFGDVSGTQIHLEASGAVLQVTEDQTDSKWMHEKSNFLLCDFLGITDQGTYETRLKLYEPVTCKAVLAKSTTDPAVYGHDAVCYYQDWGADPAKHLLNAACLVTSLKNSETPHTVDLVWDDIRSNADTLYLELHHQGQGESFEDETHETSDFQIDIHYLRFDLSGAIPSSAGRSIVLSFEWDWFEDQNNLLFRDKPKHFQVCKVLQLE